MTDRELSTRDLADAADTSTESRADAPDETRTEEPAPADEPLGRERSETMDTGSHETAPADEALARQRSEPDDSTSVGDTGEDDERSPLLPADETDGFTTRWREIQIGFVDEPRESVAKADALVADLMQRLAASFSEERQRLESQWDQGDDVSTEDLRVALTRYRSFFDRLLSA